MKTNHTPMAEVGENLVFLLRKQESGERWPVGTKLYAETPLILSAEEMLADLHEAAATLRRYETLHRAKGTADSDAKAEVNAALASRFEATIAKATRSQA